jgi:hypothetical protein
LNKLEAKILKKWLRIPRWVRLFTLNVITIYVIFVALFKGIEALFYIEALSFGKILFCLGIALFFLFILYTFSKKVKIIRCFVNLTAIREDPSFFRMVGY